MTDDPVRDFIEECQGMSDAQIIAAHHAEYYDEQSPHVRQAFAQMGIDEHEVAAWVRLNIK